LSTLVEKLHLHKKAREAFTIIEILIVVTVLAILSLIGVLSYRVVYTNAQATGVETGLKKLDESMKLWASTEHKGTWPVDPVGGGGTSITTMIQNDPGFKRYVDNVPAVQGVQTQDWFYDNEGDTKTDCAAPYAGVNIVIRYVDNAAVAKKVDEALDDGDINCGRVRYVDRRIFWTLSNTQKVTE